MLKKILSRIRKDKKGEIFVEIVIKFLVITVLILFALNLFDVAIKYQNVSYTAKSIAKVVELEGSLTNTAYEQLNDLNHNFNMDMEFEISDVTYFDSRNKTIQFRDPFTITATYEYDLKILSPIFTTKPVVITIPMKADVSGMSEIYWK